MQNSIYRNLIVLSLGTFAAASASAQTDIARWNFTTGDVLGHPAPYNTPVATTNNTTAFATQLGMTNNYTNSNGTVTTTGNTASCDVLNSGTDPNPLSTGFTWRIRAGSVNGSTSGNGWALQAAQYTQGAEFDISTVGYTGVKFSFDWFSTTQGVKNLQVQYNTNTTNAAGWTNFAGFFGNTSGSSNVATSKDGANNTLLIATSNGYNTAGTNSTTNLINFLANGIGGVDNNANFGIRLVSAYDPGLGNYASAAGGVYNNNSGNWRFDQIALQGVQTTTAAPEASTIALAGIGLLGTVLLRRRQKSK